MTMRADRKRVGPHHIRSCVVYITAEEALRVRRVVITLGWGPAIAKLGVGKPTIEAAMEQGRMQRATHERLFAAVARYEAERAAS
jgi:hypothetical protein